jgi:enoyl-CoA hydratase/carnithine racemase
MTDAPVAPIALVEDAERVRVVTFNRPEALNAFDTPLYDAVADALESAAVDDEIGAVVLTGAGRGFSSGQDLKEMAGLAAAVGGRGVAGLEGDEAPAVVSGFPHLLDALSSHPKPLLAAVNGVALGIGFTMLAHCDLVLVAEGARARTPFTELGVAPEAASSYLFPVRMGWQRAAKVLLGSEWVSAEQLVEYGLALEVVPPDQLRDRTIALAKAIAAMPLASVMATKRLMVDPHREAIARALTSEGNAFGDLLGSAANTAAIQAKLG